MSLQDLAKNILSDVLADFRAKNLGLEALSEEYVGPSIVALEVKYCSQGAYSKLDFDLSMKELEENKFVGTGPMVPYENTPGSQLVIVAIFSKREYVYLTEKGYKAPRNLRQSHARQRPACIFPEAHFINRPSALEAPLIKR